LLITRANPLFPYGGLPFPRAPQSDIQFSFDDEKGKAIARVEAFLVRASKKRPEQSHSF